MPFHLSFKFDTCDKIRTWNVIFFYTFFYLIFFFMFCCNDDQITKGSGERRVMGWIRKNFNSNSEVNCMEFLYLEGSILKQIPKYPLISIINCKKLWNWFEIENYTCISNFMVNKIKFQSGKQLSCLIKIELSWNPFFTQQRIMMMFKWWHEEFTLIKCLVQVNECLRVSL